jgi:hypothetical protein
MFRYKLAALLLMLATLACNAPSTLQPTPGITEIMPLPNTAVATGAATAAPTDAGTGVLTPTLADGGLSLEQLKNMSYQVEIVPSGVAALVDGHYEEPNPELGGITGVDFFEPVGYGDLNSDGAQDALVRLVVQTGSTTGRFSYLYAMLNQNGVPVQTAFVWLGDRIILNAIRVDADGLITVDMIVASPNDGACCPNTPAIQKYRLEGADLVLIE